jgi:hypothetical protein
MKEDESVVSIVDIADGKEFKLKVKEFEITAKLFRLDNSGYMSGIIEQMKDTGFREMTTIEIENFGKGTQEGGVNPVIESAYAYSVQYGDYHKYYLNIHDFVRRIALRFKDPFSRECFSFLGVKS